MFKEIKKDFPIFKRKINGQKLVYLDNAATTQKPQIVIDTLKDFYEHHNANIHRGIYRLSEEATELYETAREKVRKFIEAKETEEIIFTRGTTESINLVAYAWGRQNIEKGDEIIVTEMEHHSNLVPWQVLAKEKEATLKFIPIDNEGHLQITGLDSLLSKKTKLLALTHVSNVLGVVNPLKEIITKAHSNGTRVLVDGAQAVPYLPVDVSELDCDFYAFSGHKMLGPTGIGVLYGKKELLEAMPPFMSGGDMIEEVTKERTTWNDLPAKFEAGTMPIAQAVGLGAAIDYLNDVGLENIWQHEQTIITYALEKIKAVPGIKIYGPLEPKDKGGILSFNIGEIHPHDLASIFDEAGVAIRAGHHCAQVLLNRLGTQATARASFYLYNDQADVDKLVEVINKAKELLP
ncbi:MAG: cysteine desulfurase [Candidatus Kerfeldbacteria bacterium CG_4_10_14_0_8_um_filter_42_10]|uniref:Cysteine desulfurase n=1 Tax=Candidatus Kerfeldbacteria bacterium CG_4_10_14_0_8_um_filter_42_10 TaxID=2014248 RepID=A0A2M7RG74_9BACT|nr:MAG: cysteine desulfurase [Candidatus Kerfeldbacteria bacterium CG_4_10_14_0_8_um_filter_42_10]